MFSITNKQNTAILLYLELISFVTPRRFTFIFDDTSIAPNSYIIVLLFNSVFQYALLFISSSSATFSFRTLTFSGPKI